MPPPVVAPPATAFEEVTNGYDPWSRSRSVPWAPSSSTCSPRASADWTSQVVSSRCSARRSPHPAALSTSASTSKPSAPIEPSRRFLSGSSRSSRDRRTDRSRRSPMRSPTRQARSPYAGPMPRPVVPTLAPSRRASFARSRATWYGMITWALRLTRTRRDVDPARGEHVELADERLRVHHDAVPDDRRDVRVEHARRHEVELQDLVALDHRVAGVVAALVAHDHRDLLGQEVGRLALALVAPLEADDDRGWH